MRENLSDMLKRWEREREEADAVRIAAEQALDAERASRAGLGIDPAWLAARERAARVQWIRGE